LAINLLPPKYRPKPLIEWKRLKKYLLISIIIFSLVYFGTYYYFYRTFLEKKMVNLQENIENLQPVYLKLEDYETSIENAKEIEKLANKIGKAKQVWSSILADIAGSLNNNIWFINISKKNNDVIIEGEAFDFSTVGEFAVKIRGLKWFEQVDVDCAEKIDDISGRENSGNILGIKRRDNIELSNYVEFVICAKLKSDIDLFVLPESGETK